MAGRGVAAGYLAHALRLDGQPQIPTLEEVMKVSLKALEHYGSVVAMLAFAFMTWLAVCFSMLFTFKEWRDSNYSGIDGSANFDIGRGGSAYPPQATAATTTYA